MTNEQLTSNAETQGAAEGVESQKPRPFCDLKANHEQLPWNHPLPLVLDHYRMVV